MIRTLQNHKKEYEMLAQAEKMDSKRIEIFIQTEILKIEDDIAHKKRSPELAWNKFWIQTSKKVGDYSKIIDILLNLDYTDQQIFSFLMTAEYPNKQIVRILASAGWDQTRIVETIMNFFFEKSQEKSADDEIISFLMLCGWDDVEFIKALLIADCLTFKTIKILFDLGWDKERIVDAAVRTDLINKWVIGLFIPIPKRTSIDLMDDESPEKPVETLMTIQEFSDFLQKKGFNQKNIVAIIGKIMDNSIDCIKLLATIDFKLNAICQGLLESGYPIGKIIGPIYSFWILSSQDDNLSEQEIILKRSKIITLMKKLKLSDQQIFEELHDLEWTILMIIESMIAAKFSKQRIIKAFFKARFKQLSVTFKNDQLKIKPIREGMSDYFIMEAISQAQAGFAKASNHYWDSLTVSQWKTAIRKFLASQEIAD